MRKNLWFIFVLTLLFFSCSNFSVDLSDFFDNAIETDKNEIVCSENTYENSCNQADSVFSGFNFIFKTQNGITLSSADLENHIFSSDDIIILSKIENSKTNNLLEQSEFQTKFSIYQENILIFTGQENFVELNKIYKSPETKYTLKIDFTYKDLNLEADFLIRIK